MGFRTWVACGSQDSGSMRLRTGMACGAQDMGGMWGSGQVAHGVYDRDGKMACGAHDKGGMHIVHGCRWGLEHGSYVRFRTGITCGVQDRCDIHMRFRTGVHTHGVQNRMACTGGSEQDGMCSSEQAYIHMGFRTGVYTHGFQNRMACTGASELE